jgi:hypothetical protein
VPNGFKLSLHYQWHDGSAPMADTPGATCGINGLCLSHFIMDWFRCFLPMYESHLESAMVRKY